MRSAAHQRILSAKKDGAWDVAVDILYDMKGKGRNMGTVSYNAAIDACGKAKRVDRALELFDELVAAGNVPDAVTYTALIDACGRVGMLDMAFMLFQRCALPRSLAPAAISASSAFLPPTQQEGPGRQGGHRPPSGLEEPPRRAHTSGGRAHRAERIATRVRWGGGSRCRWRAML